MFLMSVPAYSCRPQGESMALTRVLAALPPLTTDTNTQFLYVCTSRHTAAAQHKHTTGAQHSTTTMAVVVSTSSQPMKVRDQLSLQVLMLPGLTGLCAAHWSVCCQHLTAAAVCGRPSLPPHPARGACEHAELLILWVQLRGLGLDLVDV